MIEFRSSKGPTIGVELELQIVSKRDRSLLNIAPEVLQRIETYFRRSSIWRRYWESLTLNFTQPASIPLQGEISKRSLQTPDTRD